MKIFSRSLFVLFLFAFTFVSASGDVTFDGKSYFFTNKLKIKLSSKAMAGKTINQLPAELTDALKNIGVTNIEKAYTVKNKNAKSASVFDRIINVSFTSPYDVKLLASKINRLKSVEAAEPWFLAVPDYTPDDPQINQQYHLAIISAYEAWDITQGDTSVVVAIDDTGVDWDHPDLEANIYINEAELNGTPGVDDDNNGYVDDIRGWDFGGLTGTPDNDPVEDRSDHGTHVAGCTAQVTDNGIAGAGIGFNCRLLPVKTAQDNIRSNDGRALIAYGYEGIIYAVDNGAKIINCSWGGYDYSIISQDVINYARENNVLVIAASGNDNSQDSHYPSAYEGVLSVASTTSSDTKSSFSNYGMTIDVSAPGSSIRSTWQNDTYASLSGTSMASPVTAGTAALVASRFPEFTAEQIGEQVRVTADDIYANNSSYLNKLGIGRVNAFTAVTDTLAKSVRANNFIFTEQENSNGNGVFERGETIALTADFKNILAATNNLTISVEVTGNVLTVVNSSYQAGSVNTLETFSNISTPFTFTISDNAPENSRVNILIKYQDGSYEDYQWVSLFVNPTYATQSGNELAMTITSKGTLGYNNYSSNTQGNGFRFRGGDDLMFEGAFMVGISDSRVMDAARGATGSSQDTDFQVELPFLLSTPGEVADQQGYSVFTDAGAGSSSKIGLKINFHSFSFANQPYDKSIILKYVITNTSAADIIGLHAGIFFDWDINADYYETNLAEWNDEYKFGYAHNENPEEIADIAAAALISSDKYNFYPIKNDGTPGVYDGFTTAEKWLTLSSGTEVTQAGPFDISMVIAAGPYDIYSGESVDVAFVIAADTTLEGVAASVIAARNKYRDLITSVEDETTIPEVYSLAQNYPNPFNPSTVIKYNIAEAANVKIKVFDILGREVRTLVNTYQQPGSYNVDFNGSGLSSGMYFYSIEAGSFSDVKKMMMIK